MLLLLLHVRVTINFGLCVSRNSFLFLRVLFVLLEGELLGGKPTINGYGPLLLGWKIIKNYRVIENCYWKKEILGNSAVLAHFVCLVNKKRQITSIVSNSIDGIRSMELFISWFDWKLLGYWKCDHCDFLLEWVIGCILLSLLPDGLEGVKRVFLTKVPQETCKM